MGKFTRYWFSSFNLILINRRVVLNANQVFRNHRIKKAQISNYLLPPTNLLFHLRQNSRKFFFESLNMDNTIHAVLFIRNVVKICPVLILIFCIVVSYFRGHILASCFIIFMHELWKKSKFLKTVKKYEQKKCFLSYCFLVFE